MITASEITKDLDKVIKKVEFLQVTYPRNELWPTIYERLKDVNLLIKTDIKMFGYD